MMTPSSPMPRTSNPSISWTPMSSSLSKHSVLVAGYAQVDSWPVHQSGLPLLVCSPPSMSRRQSMRTEIQLSRKMNTRPVSSREYPFFLHPGSSLGRIKADEASSTSFRYPAPFKCNIRPRSKVAESLIQATAI